MAAQPASQYNLPAVPVQFPGSVIGKSLHAGSPDKKNLERQWAWVLTRLVTRVIHLTFRAHWLVAVLNDLAPHQARCRQYLLVPAAIVAPGLCAAAPSGSVPPGVSMIRAGS